MTNTNAGRRAAILVLVVFLLGVLLGGVGDRLWGDRLLHRHASSARGPVAELTRELNLTSDQQKQLGGIMDDTRAQLRLLYAPANAQCHALYAPLDSQHDQIRGRGRDRIRAILTPEQKTKFEAFLRAANQERKKSPGR